MLLELIHAFNEGNEEEVNKILSITRDEDLLARKDMLYEKIKIMKLLEYIFSKESGSSTIKISTISQLCNIDNNLVDVLLIKCFSLGLFSGKIDDVNSEVNIESVKPRVLDNKRIFKLKEKYDNWEQRIKFLNKQIEENN